jgi:hypothetical protein
VDASGNYGPVTSSAPQTSGEVTTQQVDAANNASPTTVETAVDTKAPLAPTQVITPNTDGTLSVSGTGEPGATVTVTFPDGTTGTATVDASGHYGPLTSSAPQTSGEVATQQVDAANNASPTATETVVDTTAPLTPTQFITPNPDGTLSVSGTGEPGSTVTVTFPDGSTRTAPVDANGNYGPITSEAPQTTGEVNVTQTDEGGNASPVTGVPYVDTSAPLAPTQTVTPNPDGTLSVTGTGEPGSTVTVTFPDGSTGTVVIDEQGHYGPIVSETPQTDGPLVTAQTDRAGNTSTESSDPYEDTTPPMAPVIIVDFNAEGIAIVTGTAEPGSLVTISFPDGSTQSIEADAEGNYGPLSSLGRQGPGEFTAVSTDEAGNPSETALTPFAGNLEMDDNAVLLSKSVNQKQVSMGDQLYYTIRAENTTESSLDIEVLDNLPDGFKLTTTNAKFTRAGVDATFGTSDDVVSLVSMTGTDSVRFNAITLAVDEKVQFGYLLKVGVTAYPGRATNTAQVFRQGSVSDIGSNLATASVQVVADTVLEQSTLIGKVFHDRDGDGYQDPANVTGLTLRSDYFGWNSLHLGGLNARVSAAEDPAKHRKVVRMPLGRKNDFQITTQQGTVINVSAQGEVTQSHKGEKARGLTGQDLKVSIRRIQGIPTVTPVVDQQVPAVPTDVLEISLTNHGIDEVGLPGIRLASVTGLLIETDGHGRYHLPDVGGGSNNRDQNLILKVDQSTLPQGATLTTENPRVIRISSGALHKVNFGVKFPEAKQPVPHAGAANTVEVTLQEDFFIPNGVTVQPQNRIAIDEIVTAMQQNGGGTVRIKLGQSASSIVLGRARANLIRQQLHQRLGNLMGKVTVVAK